jgi:hypothetical protein
MGRFLGFQKRRARQRVLREISNVGISLESQAKSSEDCGWLIEARGHLEEAKRFDDRYDADGAWSSLQAARRALINGMSDAQLGSEVIAVREESTKLASWRRAAIVSLLTEPPLTDKARLICACKIRDDYFVNQYHKVRLTSDQLIVLGAITSVAFILTLLAITRCHEQMGNWEWPYVCAIVGLGIVGSGFSVAQSIIGMVNTTRVPEYVANYWVTAMRTLFGAVTALAGHAFYASHIIKIQFGDFLTA